MKVPVYLSEQTANLPQLNTPRVPKIDLSSLVNFAESKYMDYQKDQEEKKKIAIEIERQKTGFAIEEKYVELKDRIANGGAYSKAYDEFNNFYNKTVENSLKTFGDDENVSELSRLEYQQMGFKYGLSLRSAIKSRSRSDAKKYASQRLSLYQDQIVSANTVEEQVAAIQNASRVISGLQASGVIDDGDSEIANFVSNSVVKKVGSVANKDPSTALSMAEQHKDSIDPSAYEALQNDLTPKAKNQVIAQGVDRFLNDETIDEPSDDDVDGYTADKQRQLDVGQTDQAKYEKDVSLLLLKSGKISKPIMEAISIDFATEVDAITPNVAAKIASNARIIGGALSIDPRIANAKGNIPKEARTIANMIVEKTLSGVDEYTAVRETLKKFNDPTYSVKYDGARKSILGTTKAAQKAYADLNETLAKELKIENTSLVLSDAVDIYATAIAGGATSKSAQKEVINQLKGKYSKFNGVDVEMPPHEVTQFTDEKQWLKIAQPTVDAMTGTKGVFEPVLFGDEMTRQAIKSGKKPHEIPFRIGAKTGDNDVLPLTEVVDGVEQYIYINANPVLIPKTEKEIQAENYRPTLFK